MKLRTAKKIRAAVGTPRESAYSDGRIGAAQRRYERTKESRDLQAWWSDFVKTIPWRMRLEWAMRDGNFDLAADIIVANVGQITFTENGDGDYI